MGRGKIDIKRIENPNNRQVTFSKRKNGIIKKAREIAILCEASIAVVIISSTGKVFEHCSENTTTIKMLDEYQKLSQKKVWDTKHECLNNEIERVKKDNDSMQIKLRHLKGDDISNLHHNDLIYLEDALDEGLKKVRSKRSELMKMQKKKDRVLEEENRHLSYILHQQQISMDGNVSEINNGYRHDVKDYPSQMPFAFRVLPSHPNLQDMK